MTVKTVLAVRISRTYSFLTNRNYLSPFAMYKAFPCSDYYGDSVTMGVSPFR